MRKVKLADVLWKAANERLWSGIGSQWIENYKSEYSCCAVTDALIDVAEGAWGNEAEPFLRRLGCPVNSERQTFLTQITEERQGRRYMWLLLAMHVAEDEDIEIEVAQ